MSNEKKHPKQKERILFYVLISVFACLFVVSAVFLGNYLIQSYQAGSDYDDLGNMLDDIRATMPTNPSTTVPPTTGGESTNPSSEETTETEPAILPDYLPIYQLNSDTVGWITVPDTKINYPVMQTPDRPDYYLNRNFNKMSSDWGAIYARESCDINRPSDNITLYGHHMKDGSMFAGLDKFKQQSFWETHQTFTFDTLYERHTYQIWAVFKISANLDSGFLYHRFSDAATEEEFNEFVSKIKSLDFYDTGITPQYGDKLLTLSTCEYTLDNGRFVVCAVRVS